MEQGEAVAYALNMLEERGILFIAPGDKLYEGMVIGENAKPQDLEVNPLKSKQLTNFRASGGKDDAIRLTPPQRMTLEQAIAYIQDDELVEVTPKVMRIRKRYLDPHERKQAKPEGRSGLSCEAAERSDRRREAPPEQREETAQAGRRVAPASPTDVTGHGPVTAYQTEAAQACCDPHSSTAGGSPAPALRWPVASVPPSRVVPCLRGQYRCLLSVSEPVPLSSRVRGGRGRTGRGKRCAGFAGSIDARSWPRSWEPQPPARC